ncbi:S8 family peptidase [Peribacillus loiseleuriae]|uniref:S8 family peptidase n=1 Tax=Peribacillus loiseleuriae TaxID=1679170 RepID=UPI0038117C86
MKLFYKKIVAMGLSTALLVSAATPAVFAAERNSIKPASITSIGKNKASAEQEKKNSFSDDQLIIKYTKPLTATEHRNAGATVIQQFSNLNYAVVKVKDKKNIHKVIQQYQKNNNVQLVTPSVLYKSFGIKDPKAIEQYHLSLLNVAKAQSLAGKHPVTVAVIDTGIDRKHPDLKNTLLPGYNTVDPLNQPFVDSHGTHVAGIIAANKDNGIGGYGMAPNVKILPIDVFDGWFASDYAIAEGILYAVDHGAKVINMSLGGAFPSPLIEEAVKTAIDKGVVIVAAAGNDGEDFVNYPAGYEGVISVGAVDKNSELTYFSTYGASVDLVAPGDEVYSTVYDYSKGSSFTKMSGTSMASPVVAGAAALLLSKYPDLTPTQVKYILKQTATDLGDKGFDIKYGSGLVNIVSALQYNTKNITQIVKENWTKSEINKSATMVTATEEPQVIKGEITKPFEQKWIQFKVEEGDYIQTVLDGAAQYDYKMMLHFYGDGNKTKKIEVNKAGAGKTEAEMVQAPFSGTIAIGVKDVNGNYDSSSSKQSNYSLSVQTAKALPEDDSSIENMIKIDSLPYQSSGKHTFTGDKEDNDYFTFEIDGEKAVKITLSGVPGVNPNLSVYKVDDILPSNEGNGMTEAEKAGILKNLLEGEEYNDPYAYSNSGGTSEPVELSFAADPGTYILKTSNKASNYFGIFELIQMLLMGVSFDDSTTIEQSLIPYQVKIDTKVLPEDEDHYPSMEGESITNEHSKENGEVATIRAAAQSAVDPDIEEQNAYVQSQLDAAIPYELGKTTSAYLQTASDIDLFTVKPEETAIYELNLKNKENKIPLMEIYQVKEDKTKDGGKTLNLNYLGDNMDWSGYTIGVKEKNYTGLKKGETYLFIVQNNYMNDMSGISFEPYEISTKLIVSNPEDPYEDNDSFEKNVKNLPGATFNANFAMPNDIDVFYYQATQTGIKGVTVQTNPAEVKQTYPKELLGQYAGVVTIVEDRNNNRKLDDEEFNNATYIQKGNYGYIYGSVNVKKGHNYFIITEGYFRDMLPFSLIPYTFTFKDAPTKDEDAGSIVKNNVPSKPLKLTKDKDSVLQSAKGYFNAGVPNGDSDWYEYEATKDSSGVIKLAGGKVTDGMISVYQNGKLIAQADYYGAGDEEVLYLNLKKGKYHIEVKDSYGNASVDPYLLRVNMQ